MKLEIPTFSHNGPIALEHCFMVPAEKDHAEMGQNRSPELRWSDVPEGTRSFAVICVDHDVPSEGDLVNQEGKTVPADLPRTDFYHWVLVDIPADRRELAAGIEADGIVSGGKDVGPTDYGVRGRNDYTSWFAGDEDMEGVYGGYDGPAPPWNDERLHHYHFKVFALDVESLDLPDGFDGPAAMRAISEHTLAEAEHVGTYTLNPNLRS